MNNPLLNQAKIIKSQCLKIKSTNPIEIAMQLMENPEIHMHGPEHHILDGASFLVAIHEANPDFDLEKAIDTLIDRAIKMPGATCGQWGVCASASSIGAALAIIHQTTPLSNNSYYQANLFLTSKILMQIAKIGGPRCCKRNAYIALSCAIDFVKEQYGIHLEKTPITCAYHCQNPQCLKEKCPYFPIKNDDISLRQITLNDYHSAAYELIEAFKGEPWNEDWSYQAAYNRISQIMSSPLSRGFVAIQNGEVVGMLCGKIMTYLNEELLMAEEFSIHPKCQGQHLGQKLMSFAKEEMAKEGIYYFSLITERGYPCVKFYENQGFKEDMHSVVMSWRENLK